MGYEVFYTFAVVILVPAFSFVDTTICIFLIPTGPQISNYTQQLKSVEEEFTKPQSDSPETNIPLFGWSLLTIYIQHHVSLLTCRDIVPSFFFCLWHFSHTHIFQTSINAWGFSYPKSFSKECFAWLSYYIVQKLYKIKLKIIRRDILRLVGVILYKIKRRCAPKSSTLSCQTSLKRIWAQTLSRPH